MLVKLKYQSWRIDYNTDYDHNWVNDTVFFNSYNEPIYFNGYSFWSNKRTQELNKYYHTNPENYSYESFNNFRKPKNTISNIC